MFAVATFSDADGYTSSGDYQATISWGAGLPPSVGFVDGGAGVFRVCGNYHYATEGTYTVTATVTDRDGRSATATSTVVVGDVIAGQTSQVQIGPFSNTDPTPFYVATIWWGTARCRWATWRAALTPTWRAATPTPLRGNTR